MTATAPAPFSFSYRSTFVRSLVEAGYSEAESIACFDETLAGSPSEAFRVLATLSGKAAFPGNTVFASRALSTAVSELARALRSRLAAGPMPGRSAT